MQATGDLKSTHEYKYTNIRPFVFILKENSTVIDWTWLILKKIFPEGKKFVIETTPVKE